MSRRSHVSHHDSRCQQRSVASTPQVAGADHAPGEPVPMDPIPPDGRCVPDGRSAAECRLLDAMAGPATVADVTMPTKLQHLLERAERLLGCDPGGAVRAANAALVFAREVGEARHVARALCLIAQAQNVRGRWHAALRVAEQACAMFAEHERPPELACALLTAGISHRRLRHYAEARRALIGAVRVASLLGLRGVESEAFTGLGAVAADQRDIQLARALLARARAIASESAHPEAEARAVMGLGICHFICCEWVQASECHRLALELAGATRNQSLIAHIRCNLTSSEIAVGNLPEVLRAERRNFRVLERLGDRHAMRISLNSIAICARSMGRYDVALDAQIRALRLAETLADSHGIATVMCNLGELYEALGDAATAAQWHQKGLGLACASNDDRLEVLITDYLVAHYMGIGQHSAAFIHAVTGLHSALRMADRYGEIIMLNALGRLHLQQGDLGQARSHLHRALELAQRTGSLELESCILELLAGVAERDACPAEALSLLGRAYAVAERNGHHQRCAQLLPLLEAACRAVVHAEHAPRPHRQYPNAARQLIAPGAARRIRRRVAEFERAQRVAEGRAAKLDESELAAVASLASQELDHRLRLLRPDAQGVGSEHGNTTVGARVGLASTRLANNACGTTIQAPSYRVVALGSLRLWVGDTEIAPSAWGRKRARDLFKLLLVRYRRQVAIDEIIELLWNGSAGANAELLAMNAVSHLRRVLEPARRPHARSATIAAVNRTYVLDLGPDADIDIVRFRACIEQARHAAHGEPRCRAYECAIELYGDDLLKEDLYADWTASERELLKDMLLEALEFVGRDAVANLRFGAALDAGRRILAADATGHEGYAITAAALRGLHRGAELPALAERCAAAYRRELGCEPPERLRQLLRCP